MSVSIKTYDFDGITLLYWTDGNGVTSFNVLPLGRAVEVRPSKLEASFLKDKFGHLKSEPMVQVALAGDSAPRDFTAGLSLKNSSTAYSLRLKEQRLIERENESEVITELIGGGIKAIHRVRVVKGYSAAEVCCEIINISEKPAVLELAASFSLTGITPFTEENDVGNILIHRLKSNWSAEGMLVSDTAARLSMEDSWSSFGARGERIGQVGSMPARGWLPFYAVEDGTNGITWAAQLEAPGSWQIEAAHHNSYISVTGGQADYNFGHWRKTLKKGGSFKTLKAFVTATNDGLNKACDNITRFFETRLCLPETEESLPVIYNEYCYTWGYPDMEKLVPLIDYCAKRDIKYFVMDAGWYRSENGYWFDLGDWRVNMRLFPNGLKEFTDKVAGCGLLPGIWFEFESLTDTSCSFRDNYGLVATRAGVPVRSENRCFLDFRKSGTIEFLAERVIKLLKDNGFKYVKIDYNESMGIGLDSSEGEGEGLRSHLEQVVRFYRLLKESVPGLVMEICSSGGMRHEPLFISLGSMSSFSDAHEGPEGAVIAANLHRFMLPRQMQIWATIRDDYNREKAIYTIVKAMLGRYCLSGNLPRLSEDIKETVDRSLVFYGVIKGIIKNGETVLIDNSEIETLRFMKGRQRVERFSRDRKSAVFYAFSVGVENPEFTFDCPGYRVADSFGSGIEESRGDKLFISGSGGDWFARAVYLVKE